MRRLVGPQGRRARAGSAEHVRQGGRPPSKSVEPNEPDPAWVGQRLVVYLMGGGVAGFGAVFLQLPGIVLALVLLGIVAGTGRGRFNLVRVGGYLMGTGLVAWSLVGPAVRGGGGFLFLNGWVLVTGYAVVAVTGALLVAALAVIELRRSRVGRRGGRPRAGCAEHGRQGGTPPSSSNRDGAH